jgi:hypothetical protein
MKLRTLCFGGLVLTAVVGCGSSDEAKGGGAGGGGGTPGLVGAAGVRITRVDFYQAVRRPLMVDGNPAESSVPLVQGRAGIARVYYATDGGYNGQPVTARFSVNGADPIESTTGGGLPGNPTDADLGSTFNFDIPADKVGANFEYRAEILQASGADNAAAKFPANGFASVPVGGKANKFRMVIVPYAYGADGSNRLPDLGPDQLEKIRGRFYSMMPVSDVEITVHEPVPWSGTLDAEGNGWFQVGLNLNSLRTSEVGVGSDVYYYGMFNPAAAFQNYCRTGCLLGVTQLNEADARNPAGNPQFRIALGVGFVGYSENTAVHEIGHSHGRGHAPCAPANQIRGVDPAFPHAGARLGDWGYDLVTKKLQDPNRATDIMGYCNNQFVSDYTYKALHERGQLVNLPKVHGSQEYELLATDGNGKASWGGRFEYPHPAPTEGPVVRVAYLSGGSDEVNAWFYPYDHLEGGWLLVPVGRGQVANATFSVGGVRYDARR